MIGWSYALAECLPNGRVGGSLRLLADVFRLFQNAARGNYRVRSSPLLHLNSQVALLLVQYCAAKLRHLVGLVASLEGATLPTLANLKAPRPTSTAIGQ